MAEVDTERDLDLEPSGITLHVSRHLEHCAKECL